jgi:hypothetical protein
MRSTLAWPRPEKRLWHDFADLGPLETNVIDSGTRTANAIADVLAERLKSGLLVT